MENTVTKEELIELFNLCCEKENYKLLPTSYTSYPRTHYDNRSYLDVVFNFNDKPPLILSMFSGSETELVKNIRKENITKRLFKKPIITYTYIRDENALEEVKKKYDYSSFSYYNQSEDTTRVCFMLEPKYSLKFGRFSQSLTKEEYDSLKEKWNAALIAKDVEMFKNRVQSLKNGEIHSQNNIKCDGIFQNTKPWD